MTPQPLENADFAGLWVSVQTTLSAYVRSSVRDAQHAEDLLQDVARQAFQNFDRYDAGLPFLPWAMGIARFAILNYYRTQRNEKLIFGEMALTRIETAHTEIAPEIPTRRSALERCMAKLQTRSRQCLEMRYSHGKAVEKIAARMDTTPNAISMVLFRARAALKKCVDKQVAAEEHRGDS